MHTGMVRMPTYVLVRTVGHSRCTGGYGPICSEDDGRELYVSSSPSSDRPMTGRHQVSWCI